MDGAEARVGDMRAAATTIAAAELDAACLGFHRQHPQRSAKRRLHATQALCIVTLIGLVIVGALSAPGAMLTALYIGAIAFFAAAISLRLIAAAQLTPKLYRLADPAQFPTYTILCPLYREANVVADLVTALALIDYPSSALDIKLLVEGDDHATIDAALRASANAPHIEVVIVPPAAPRTKPKALNAGLARARGAYTVVYDAEDRPHPQQLRAALAAFEDGGPDLACVQAPLSIDNADASWIARQFAAEYAIQFRELLPMLARFKLPLPLGGTSNHFRTDVLRAVGGWDPFNVNEDYRKFPNNFGDLQRGTLRVPITSQCEKWSVKGLIGKGKTRDTFNVREKIRTFLAQNQRFVRASIFASRSALISVGNCKKCAIGRHGEALISAAHRAFGPRRSYARYVRA